MTSERNGGRGDSCSGLPLVVEALCDRVGIISNGRLLALDSVEGLKSAYGFDFKIAYSVNGDSGTTKTMYGKNCNEHLYLRMNKAG